MKNILLSIIISLVSYSLILAEETKNSEESKKGEAALKSEVVKNKDAVEIYEKFALKQYSDFWTGYGFSRNYDMKKFSSNGMVTDPELLKLLLNSPSSRSYAEAYQREHIVGSIFYWTGLGMLVADMVFVTMTQSSVSTMTNQIVFWSLLGGGFTTSIIGSGFMISAYQKIQEAVWQYNKDLISGATKVSQVNEPRFNLAFGTQF